MCVWERGKHNFGTCSQVERGGYSQGDRAGREEDEICIKSAIQLGKEGNPGFRGTLSSVDIARNNNRSDFHFEPCCIFVG